MIIHFMLFAPKLEVHSCICDYDEDFFMLSFATVPKEIYFIGNECIYLQMLVIHVNQKSSKSKQFFFLN